MVNEYSDLQLCAYLFVSDNLDNNHNIFESFIPLVESILVNKERCISFTQLKDEINNIYGTKIPRATLKRLVNKLQRKGKVVINGSSIEIKGELLDSSYTLKNNSKINEIEDLFISFKDYVNQFNCKIDVDGAKNIICNFIFSNSCELASFLDGTNINFQNEEDAIIESEYILYICDFILYCKKNDTKKYELFLKLYKGAVEASLLNFKPKKIESIENEKIDLKKVILDTNFILRILDLQGEFECVTAKETLKLLMDMDVEFIVLKQTIDETSKTISFFRDEYQPYSQQAKKFYRNKNVRFSGILSAIKRGVTLSELCEISRTSNLEKILKDKYNVTIIENYESDIDESRATELVNQKNRDSYKEKQAKHDLTLIDYCSSQRGKNEDEFSKCTCWVLTNDIKLTYCNRKNTDSSINECITESQLTNLLWIQNPIHDNLGLIHTMVTLASREVIEDGEFYKFLNKIRNYKLNNKDNKTRLDNLSMIYESDYLITEDIKNISDDDYEIDMYLEEKRKQNEKEKKEKSLLIKNQKQEINGINQEKSKLEIELEELKDNAKRDSDFKKELFEVENNCEILKKDLFRSRNFYERYIGIDKLAGKYVGRRCFEIFMCVFFILYFTRKLYLPKFIKMNGVFQKGAFEFILPLVLNAILFLVFYLLQLLLLGNILNKADLVNYFKAKRIGEAVSKDKELRNEVEEFINLDYDFNSKKWLKSYNDKYMNKKNGLNKNIKELEEKQKDIRKNWFAV